MSDTSLLPQLASAAWSIPLVPCLTPAQAGRIVSCCADWRRQPWRPWRWWRWFPLPGRYIKRNKIWWVLSLKIQENLKLWSIFSNILYHYMFSIGKEQPIHTNKANEENGWVFSNLTKFCSWSLQQARYFCSAWLLASNPVFFAQHVVGLCLNSPIQTKIYTFLFKLSSTWGKYVAKITYCSVILGNESYSVLLLFQASWWILWKEPTSYDLQTLPMHSFLSLWLIPI